MGSPTITGNVTAKEIGEEIAAYLPDQAGQFQQAIIAAGVTGDGDTVVVETASGQSFLLTIVEITPARPA